MLFLEKFKKLIFNKKIQSNLDMENEVSLKTIAEIPLKENKIPDLICYENEKGLTVKAFEKLITNIQFLCVNNKDAKKVMLITSPKSEEGKSYIAANLAVYFAKIGKKVLIIDGDMINGMQNKIFNIPNNLGLSNYLSNLDTNGTEINEFLNKFVNETGIKNVNLITSGTVPPNPTELLALPKLEELIKDAKVFFDIIIIDSSEILNKTEALLLTRIANSTILVTDKKICKINELNIAKEDIQNVGGKIIGLILNKVKVKKERKSKAQRKEEICKFRLMVKEKINKTIENIRKIFQDTNLKLLEESTKKEIEIKEKEKNVESTKKEKRLFGLNKIKKENTSKVEEKDKHQEDKEKSIEEKISYTEKIKLFTEKIADKYSNLKEICVKKCFEGQNKKKKEDDEENNESEDDKQENILKENTIKENELVEKQTIDNENVVLVVVDAENGFCRVLSKDYFIEKSIKGEDKSTKSRYSAKLLKSKQEYILDKYQLTIAQSQRIDTLIYETLNEYDTYLWNERSVKSNKAESYVLCVTKDFEMESEETENEHVVRSQRLRKIELKKEELYIIYKLENLWKTNKITLLDKLQLNKFAKIHEIQDTMQNENEILENNKCKKFYEEIILGAEKKLENTNIENKIKEETERKTIEEDRQIKQEELKLEQQQLEIEKKAAQERIKLEQENLKAEKKAEQDKIKEERKKEREIKKIEKKEEKARIKKERQKQKEESKMQKELEKVKQKEEARLEEELMVDNLYPKTKHNKDL